MPLTPTSRFSGLAKLAYAPSELPYRDPNAWRGSDFRNPLLASGVGATLGGGVGLLLAALMQGKRNIASADGLADVLMSKERGSVLMPTAIGALAGATLGGIGSARLNQQVANSYENEGQKYAMLKEAAIPVRAMTAGARSLGGIGMGLLGALTPWGLTTSVPGMYDAFKKRDWTRFGGEALSTVGNLAMFVPGLGLVAGSAAKGLGMMSKLWRAKQMAGAATAAGGAAAKTLGGTGSVLKGLYSLEPSAQRALATTAKTMPTVEAARTAVSPFQGAINSTEQASNAISQWGRAHPWLSSGTGTKGWGQSLMYGAPGMAAFGGGMYLNDKADQRDMVEGAQPLRPPRVQSGAADMHNIAAPAPHRDFGLSLGTADRPVYNPLSMYNNLGD